MSPLVVAEQDLMVLKTKVKKKEKYMIVRWFEMVGNNELLYELSHVEDCMTVRRAVGVIPVKKLGKIEKKKLDTIRVDHGKAKQNLTYKLHKNNCIKIAALASRK